MHNNRWSLYFVDLKPIYLESIQNKTIDADNIVGITLLILDNAQELRNISLNYVDELKRIMKEFQVEVKNSLAEMRKSKNITVNRTIVTDNKLFKDGVKLWFSKHNISLNTSDQVNWPKDHISDKLDIDLNQAVTATENFVTRQVLLKQVCTVPPWNNIWGTTEAGAGYDREKFDRYSCWKGMGMGSCDVDLGYWHYPGMPGCNWWVNKFPRERFQEIFGKDEKLKSIVEKSNLLFSS